MPPPPPGEVDAPGEVSPDPHLQGQETTLDRYKRSIWERLGGQGLAISLLIHIVALVFFGLWVVSVVTDTAKKDPDTFATGAGGGSSGDMAKIYEHKVTPKNARNLAKNTNRISTKSTTSSIALPDLPSSSVSSMMTGAVGGGASKGLGGGSGGGIGSGKGVGVGNGRNFVGKPIMGAKIFGSKVAVYLDASGSMKPYLEWVSAEIRKQFPDADIFAYNGIFTFVEDGDVVGGRYAKFDNKGAIKSRNRPPGNEAAYLTDKKSLTPYGRAIFARRDENFRAGSVGAWMDVMVREQYDALILFSDFQDGVKQFNRKDEVVYSDAGGDKVNTRTKAEEKWESEWLSQIGNDGRVKVYCFTTDVNPQPIFQACVKASGGDVKEVSWLRSMPVAMRIYGQFKPSVSGGSFTHAQWVDFAAQMVRAGSLKDLNPNLTEGQVGGFLKVLELAGEIQPEAGAGYRIAGAPAAAAVMPARSGQAPRPAR